LEEGGYRLDFSFFGCEHDCGSTWKGGKVSDGALVMEEFGLSVAVAMKSK